MRQKCAIARLRIAEFADGCAVRRLKIRARFVAIEDLQNFGHVGFGRGFVERNAERVVVNQPEIHPVRFGNFQNVVGTLVTERNAEACRKNVALSDLGLG